MLSNTNRWLSRLVENLEVSGVAHRNLIGGCSDLEIDQVSAGRDLPRSYIEFLKMLGQGAGRFFLGTDIFYPSVLGMNCDAEELLRDCESGLVLPDEAFVFAMHQGYEFLFFRIDQGDDPLVYRFREGWKRFEPVSSIFSEYILAASLQSW